MRWLAMAMVLAIAAAGGGYGYLVRDRNRLEAFCGGLDLGASILDVRRQAKRGGFRTILEPHGQLRVVLGYSSVLPGTCRVFFNPGRILEYRRFERTDAPQAS